MLASPQPSLCDMIEKKADLRDANLVKCVFDYSHQYEAQDPPCNLIVELRSKVNQNDEFVKSQAWTIIPLYDPAGDLLVGKWRCPMYKCPTKLGLDIA